LPRPSNPRLSVRNNKISGYRCLFLITREKRARTPPFHDHNKTTPYTRARHNPTLQPVHVAPIHVYYTAGGVNENCCCCIDERNIYYYYYMYIAPGKLILPETIVNWPFKTERVYTEFTMRRSYDENESQHHIGATYTYSNIKFKSFCRIAVRYAITDGGNFNARTRCSPVPLSPLPPPTRLTV